MDYNLLKRLLPGEVVEYTTRNGVRATDGRELMQHRQYSFTRGVMNNLTSCSVRLGDTHVLCSVRPDAIDGSLLEKSKIVVQL